MKQQLLLLMLLCCLAGCSGIDTYDTALGQKLRLQQRDLQKWSLQGRLLIKGDDMLTANLQWRHDNDKDVLRLAGAFGLGAVLIELDKHEIVLDDGQVKRVSQDIDAFIARQIGFYVPLTALRQWVLGEYVQGVPVMHFDNGFQQLGWRIAYNEYMSTSMGLMPHKIKVVKDNIKLKLVIDRWEIE